MDDLDHNLVFIKLGGSLITDKDQPETDQNRLDNLRSYGKFSSKGSNNPL